MSYKEADILKERSVTFFNEAKRLFNEDKYDLAIIHARASILIIGQI